MLHPPASPPTRRGPSSAWAGPPAFTAANPSHPPEPSWVRALLDLLGPGITVWIRPVRCLDGHLAEPPDGPVVRGRILPPWAEPGGAAIPAGHGARIITISFCPALATWKCRSSFRPGRLSSTRYFP